MTYRVFTRIHEGVLLNRACRVAAVGYIRARNYLDREHIMTDANLRLPGKHRRFRLMDCLRLSMIGRCVLYGIPPKTADGIVSEIIGSVQNDPERLINGWIESGTICIVEFDESNKQFIYHIYDKAQPMNSRPLSYLYMPLGSLGQDVLTRYRSIT